MRPLFISSTGVFAGQTLVAWLLLRRMKAAGKNPGFYKPLGRAEDETGVDPDVNLFAPLFSLPEPVDALCPYTLERYRERAEEFTDQDFLADVKKRFDDLAAAHDSLVVVGSSDIFVKPDFVGLPDGKFIEALDARVVLVDTFETVSNTVYSALAVGSFLGNRLAALIVNHVPEGDVPALREKLRPIARLVGERAVALIPEDRVMASFPVVDYVRLLGADVLTSEASVDELVCRTTIGNAVFDGDLRLVRRVNNKITLLGGSIAELADPDFHVRPVGVLVTGGRKPPEVIVDTLERAGVPLIAVGADSFGVLDRVESTRVQLRAEHRYKVDRLAGYLDEQVDVNRLLSDD